MSMMDEEVLLDFITEAREHLETIEPNLLELEKNPDDLSIIDEIFRPMHSLKGASGFLGLNKMNRVAHKAENILDEMRKGNIQNTPEIMDVILMATDALRQMLDNLEDEGDEGDVPIDTIIETIDSLLAGKGVSGAGTTSSSSSGGENADIEEVEDKTYLLTINSPEHLSDFLEEAEDNIETLNKLLIDLEKEPDRGEEIIQDIFRYFHNLKGNSGLIGYKEFYELSHRAESLLNYFRQNQESISSDVLDLLLKTIDAMEDMVSAIDAESGYVTPPDISALVSELEKALKKLTGEEIESKKEAEESPSPEEESREAASSVDDEDLKVFKETVKQQFENIYLALDTLEKEPDNKEYIDGLYRAFQSLKNASEYMELKEVAEYAGRTATLVDQGRNMDTGFDTLVSILRQEAEILEEMLRKEIEKMETAGSQEKPEEKEKSKEPSPSSKAVPVSSSEEKTGTSPREVPGSVEKKPSQPQAQKKSKKSDRIKTSSTIRVDHEKLDHLMNLIGELIINRNRFVLLTKELEGDRDISEIIQFFYETTDALGRISDDLQDTIMQVRMMPIKTVFSRFPRLVRDLSRKSGKKIDLIIEGEETELDKSVVEVVGDPLLHLIRNAVDHGQETPEERRAAGKPEVGKIWLRAFHEGNSVIIEVEDDGKGIDPEKIKKKAIEKGIITPQEAEKMDDREAIDLIFAPGFSTAEKVTDVSGRGVGMDVVRNNIKNLNGNVFVHTELGKGTKFVLSLPLTLAIIEALLVDVGKHTYAIPLDAVSETTKIPASKIYEVNKRKTTTLRGEVVGLVELGEILGVSNGDKKRDLLPLVIISVNERKLGLIVDTLLHRQEIVIKSMGDYLGDIHGFAGATILGDGRVILILDPNEIMSIATSLKRG